MLLRGRTLITRTMSTVAQAVASSPLVASARDRVKYEEKVPSDIDVSQSLSPLHIGAIAEDAGILPSEVRLRA